MNSRRRRYRAESSLVGEGHASTRSVLRVLGPAVLAVGGILMAIGIISFFSSFGSMSPPRYFWCALVGTPLLGIGSMLTKAAFLGSIARYTASEIAPVGRDTFNYMAEGTREAVGGLAVAVGEGLRGETGSRRDETGQVDCPNCVGSRTMATRSSAARAARESRPRGLAPVAAKSTMRKRAIATSAGIGSVNDRQQVGYAVHVYS